MKKILLAAVALSAAAPAFASDQLARSLGVEPGQYTLSQLVALKDAATRSGNEATVNLSNIGNSGRSISE